MTRSRRSRALQQLPDGILAEELQAHLARPARILEELVALLSTRGATYAEVGAVVQEAAGHLGRAVAICRERARRKLTAEAWEPQEARALEGEATPGAE